MRKCEYVFYNPSTGERFKDVKTGLKVACQKAGVKDVTWHTLRHTFASRLLRKGVDLVTVKELLGHSTVVTTMRYAHTNQEAKVRGVARLSTSDSDGALETAENGRLRLVTVFASDWEIR